MEGTYTMFFVAQYQVPRDRLKDVKYGFIVVDYRPQKEEQHKTRLPVGGNTIVHAGYARTPTADITTSNLIINSTISKHGGNIYVLQHQKSYLGTPLIIYEYIKFFIDILQ